MKKILFIFLLLAISCGDDPTISVTQSPGIIPDPPPAGTPDTGPVVMALYDGATVKFYDGDTFTDWKIGHAAYAGNRTISVDSMLYYLDTYGDVVDSDFLPVTPDFVEILGDDIYLFEKILPADALAAGAMFKHYTNVYKNGSTINHWSFNQWETASTVSTFSEVAAVNSTGSIHPVSGSYSAVFNATQSGIFIYDYDGIAKTATFKYSGVHFESWGLNNISSARYWQRADGVYYSNNGYEWSIDDGLIEQSTSLWDFNSAPFPVTVPPSEYPYVIGAGTNYESGETVTYWIECNTGYLFRYVASIDALQSVSRLYLGDGYRLTGIAKSSTVKPVMIDGSIYFHENGSIYKCDTATGSVTMFYGADVDIWKF